MFTYSPNYTTNEPQALRDITEAQQNAKHVLASLEPESGSLMIIKITCSSWYDNIFHALLFIVIGRPK